MPQVNYVKEARAMLQFAAKNGLSAKEFVLWHAIFERMNQHAVGSQWPDGYVPISNASLLALTPFGVGKSGEQVLSRTRRKLVQAGLIAYQPGRRQVVVPRYRMHYFEAQADSREAMTWQTRPLLVAGSRESLQMQALDARMNRAGQGTRTAGATRQPWVAGEWQQVQADTEWAAGEWQQGQADTEWAAQAGKPQGTNPADSAHQKPQDALPAANPAHTGVGRAVAKGQAWAAPGEGSNVDKKSLVAQGKFCPLGEGGEGSVEGRAAGRDEGVYVNLNPNNTEVPGTTTTAGGAGVDGVGCAGGRAGDKNPRACGQSRYPNADAGGTAGAGLPGAYHALYAGKAPASPPAETFDEAWRTSKKVRGAVAQRLLDRYPGPRDREDAWEQFFELLQTGVSPAEILAMYPKRDSLNRVICALKAQRDTVNRAKTLRLRGERIL